MNDRRARKNLADQKVEIERIHDAHRHQLGEARRIADNLISDALESTEEGIRDLVDEDAEVDAAVRAALVRQTSVSAMHAIGRVRDLERMGEAMAFGYTNADDGEQIYVGRMSVIDDEDVLLVDWRAPAAVPFYRATPFDRLGISGRRHLMYGDGKTAPTDELIDYSDELFDPDEIAEGIINDSPLRGEAAILAAVNAPTGEQMSSVVATIQAEQDAVVRAPSNGALVVQGGPGTGKTVVALHRAAYLLYDQRSALAESGILVVGPTNQFLNYIGAVLPSLGESGVISSTAVGLYPGVSVGFEEPARASNLKGNVVMADLLAAAVKDRQRKPAADLVVGYGARRVRIAREALDSLFDRAQRYKTHNDGARDFRSAIIEALVTEVYDPSFDNRKDAYATFSKASDVERFLLTHWPRLTPEQALNDLFGSPGLLASAAQTADLSSEDTETLFRERTPERDLAGRAWSEADIPLLDELLALLGGAIGETEEDRERERDAADEFELAAIEESSAQESGQDTTGLEALQELQDVDELNEAEELAADDHRTENLPFEEVLGHE